DLATTDSGQTTSLTSAAGSTESVPPPARQTSWQLPLATEAANVTVSLPQRHAVAVSVHDPQSIELLRGRIAQALQDIRSQLLSDAMHATATRCRGALELAHAAIERAVALVLRAEGEELVASELRIAIDDL